MSTRQHSARRRYVTSKALTEILRLAIRLARNVDPTLPILPQEVDARSLRASGATAMLCAGVDPHKIQLYGRWKSNAMIQYLHINFDPVVRRFSRLMLQHGDFTNMPTDLAYDGYVPVRSEDTS